jgi:hypothetical protein
MATRQYGTLQRHLAQARHLHSTSLLAIPLQRLLLGSLLITLLLPELSYLYPDSVAYFLVEILTISGFEEQLEMDEEWGKDKSYGGNQYQLPIKFLVKDAKGLPPAKLSKKAGARLSNTPWPMNCMIQEKT